MTREGVAASGLRSYDVTELVSFIEQPDGSMRVDPLHEDDHVLLFVGTCQSCGAYWDVRYQPVCPCGGEVL